MSREQFATWMAPVREQVGYFSQRQDRPRFHRGSSNPAQAAVPEPKRQSPVRSACSLILLNAWCTAQRRC
jgi:hypothetical protein